MATTNNVTSKSLIVYSYNSRGFSLEKQDVCKSLVNSKNNSDCIPILCNQENFLLKSNGYLIEQALDGFEILFKPATKPNLEGRPINGMFIAVSSELKKNTREMPLLNPRLKPATLGIVNEVILILMCAFLKILR